MPYLSDLNIQEILKQNPCIKEILDAGERRAKLLNGKLIIDERKLKVF